MAAAREMSQTDKDLMFLLLQHLDERKFKDTVHRLEKESGVYFNMRYFEELVTNGAWDDVEEYLNGFTKFDDNGHSMAIYFNIQKQKYLEAIDKNDHAKARYILLNDLKVFSGVDGKQFDDLTSLMALENIREHSLAVGYVDTKSARANLFTLLKQTIEANPLFSNKLQFPALTNSRLTTLISQSSSWQHHLCKNPMPNPCLKTLYVDHTCGQSKIWKMTEITKDSQLRSLRLPDCLLLPVRIMRLTYTNSGGSILALASNAIHKYWTWRMNEHNKNAKATTNVLPQMWQPGRLMINDTSGRNFDDVNVVPCFALTNTDSYVISASGGIASLFSMATFKTIRTFRPPPPATTCLAFHPLDNNIVVIGTENSSIEIYNLRTYEVIRKVDDHHRRVTGLAFSNDLKVLVSSNADARLSVWSMDGWVKQASKFLNIPSGPPAQTRVQFHRNQIHFLAVHKSQIAIYEAPKLECLKQWSSQDSSAAITDATYSCDSRSIYASVDDGSVRIFAAETLDLKCRISPTAYLPSYSRLRTFPLAIAAHPSEANQFAVGLTDGGVHVVEPMESEGRWGNLIT